MAYYIKWTEIESEFVEWGYAHGETYPICTSKMVTRKARWSTEETPERRSQALEWIAKERPGAKLVRIPD